MNRRNFLQMLAAGAATAAAPIYFDMGKNLWRGSPKIIGGYLCPEEVILASNRPIVEEFHFEIKLCVAPIVINARRLRADEYSLRVERKAIYALELPFADGVSSLTPEAY